MCPSASLYAHFQQKSYCPENTLSSGLRFYVCFLLDRIRIINTKERCAANPPLHLCYFLPREY